MVATCHYKFVQIQTHNAKSVSSIKHVSGAEGILHKACTWCRGHPVQSTCQVQRASYAKRVPGVECILGNTCVLCRFPDWLQYC